MEGVVTVTGVLSDEADEIPSIMDCLWCVCSVRGIFLGTKKQFKDIVAFVEEKGIVPVVDERAFGLVRLGRRIGTWRLRSTFQRL